MIKNNKETMQFGQAGVNVSRNLKVTRLPDKDLGLIKSNQGVGENLKGPDMHPLYHGVLQDTSQI